MFAQELRERDHETRAACGEDILENVPANAILITSDEAHFCSSGFVNQRNFCYCSESNPREIHERPLDSKRAAVCAFVHFGV